MLTTVNITTDDDNETVLVRFDGDGESDERSFRLPGRVLLERVARECLDTWLSQIKKDDRIKEVTTAKAKKGARSTVEAVVLY